MTKLKYSNLDRVITLFLKYVDFVRYCSYNALLRSLHSPDVTSEQFTLKRLRLISLFDI